MKAVWGVNVSEFLQDYLAWKEQVRRTTEADIIPAKTPEKVKGLAVVGMDGSGIIRDVIKSMVIHYVTLEIPI